MGIKRSIFYADSKNVNLLSDKLQFKKIIREKP
jgi:hypothetical protein